VKFVDEVHRHHMSPQGWKFGVAAEKNGRMVGVAMVGLPVARNLDDGFTSEVRRVATDGTRNACSFLYARTRRASFELGYRRVITYILASEPGTSLIAAGWRLVGPAGGGSWSRPSRKREDNAPRGLKMLWEAVA
jgi:hypothetical protein